VKFQQNTPKESTPIWVWVAVIAAGIGLGLILKPLLQGGSSGGAASLGTPSVRCAGIEGSELALSEFVQGGGLETGSISGNSVTFSRQYQLERPGQPALSFDAPSDASSTPLDCKNVAFGPGPRVSFTRGANAVIVELVGPLIKTFEASKDTALNKLLLEPRWKLGLKLEDYQASVPQIDDAGKNVRLTLDRIVPNRRFPTKLIMQSKDGGSSWQFMAQQSFQGF
jgi:hypothetical protein